MRQNFKRDKMKKEEMRKKKQEEKRNRRLHKNDPAPAQDTQGTDDSSPTSNPVPPEQV